MYTKYNSCLAYKYRMPEFPKSKQQLGKVTVVLHQLRCRSRFIGNINLYFFTPEVNIGCGFNKGVFPTFQIMWKVTPLGTLTKVWLTFGKIR